MNQVNRLLLKTTPCIFLSAGLLTASFVHAAEMSNGSFSHKNTRLTVASSDLEPFSLNEKTEPKNKRAVFYSDQNSSVDINEDGEPNLNMRF